MPDLTEMTNNLPPHLLASTRQFYVGRVKIGSIPIELGGGKYCHSYKQKDFDNYLSRFTAHDRKEITRGVDIMKQTQKKTTQLLASLLEQLQTDEVEHLIKELTL